MTKLFPEMPYDVIMAPPKENNQTVAGFSCMDCVRQQKIMNLRVAQEWVNNDALYVDY